VPFHDDDDDDDNDNVSFRLSSSSPFSCSPPPPVLAIVSSSDTTGTCCSLLDNDEDLSEDFDDGGDVVMGNGKNIDDEEANRSSSLFHVVDCDNAASTTTADDAEAEAFTVDEVRENFVRLCEMTGLYEGDNDNDNITEFDPEVFRGYFGSVYDENVVAYFPSPRRNRNENDDNQQEDDESETTMTAKGFAAVYEMFTEIRALDFRLRRIESRVESPTTFSYALQGANGAVSGSLSGVATVCLRTGKVVQTRRLGARISEDRVQQNLRNFFASFRGDGQPPVNFRQLATNLFDVPSLVVTTEDNGELYFDDFYNRMLELHEDGVVAQVLECVRHDVGLEFRFRLSDSSAGTYEYVVTALAVVDQGKVVGLQPKGECPVFSKVFASTSGRKSDVSGQMAARFFPQPYQGFASKVRPLPEQVEGLLLGEGTELEPTRQPRQLLKISMIPSGGSDAGGRRVLRKKNKKNSHNPSFRLVTNENDRYAGGAYLTTTTDHSDKKSHGGFRDSRQKQQAPQSRMTILHDGNGDAIACCFSRVVCIGGEEASLSSYQICGTEPILEDDVPSLEASANGTGATEFFPWFVVRTNGPHGFTVANSPQLFVDVWNGDGYDPIWAISKGGSQKGVFRALAPNEDDYVVHSLGGTTENHARLEDALAVLSRKSHDNDDDGRRQWDLTVAPGVDPAVAICLASIV